MKSLATSKPNFLSNKSDDFEVDITHLIRNEPLKHLIRAILGDVK
jgi:hypothetical protein